MNSYSAKSPARARASICYVATFFLAFLSSGSASDAATPAASGDGTGFVTSVKYHGGPLALPPLHQAAYKDDHRRIADLFDTGAEPHEAADSREPEEGRTPLLIAAKRCKTDSLRMLLARGATPTLADNNGRTPLIEAAANCHVVVVEALLAAGAGAHAPGGIDAVDARGHSALMAAAHLGNAESVRMLLSRGANPMLRSEGGKDAHAWAMSAGKTETASLLDAVSGARHSHHGGSKGSESGGAGGEGEGQGEQQRQEELEQQFPPKPKPYEPRQEEVVEEEAKEEGHGSDGEL
jgi:hypothetical protein